MKSDPEQQPGGKAIGAQGERPALVILWKGRGKDVSYGSWNFIVGAFN